MQMAINVMLHYEHQYTPLTYIGWGKKITPLNFAILMNYKSYY